MASEKKVDVSKAEDNTDFKPVDTAKADKKAEAAQNSDPVMYTTDHAVYEEGIFTKAGDPFVARSPKHESWHEVKTKEMPAVVASTSEIPSDPSYENLDVAALQAIAASKNVPTAGIEKDKGKLITAIKAANEPAL